MDTLSRFASVALLAAGGGCSSSSGGDSGGGGGPTPPAGLDARPSNATCLAPPQSAGPSGSFALERMFANLSFAAPVAMLQAPGDASRWFVVERAGTVRVFDNDPGASSTALFASIDVDTGGEGGLLGMVFHPDYPADDRVFLSWTESGAPLVSVVASFATTADGAAIDPASMQEVLRVNQDFSNHNGGQIAFGPDGLLYVGLGDGGSGGDPNGRGQDTTNLLGAMLRLDVDTATPYAVPPNNPFAANPSCPADHSSQQDCPEIFAWGLRNPWRWSFDRATGELWVGDVGQGEWEEVDIVEVGGNYGWDCREGAHDFGSPAPSCSSGPTLIDPVHEYSHALGNSITGGYVYRGSSLPALVGHYVFGDFGSGRIWRLRPVGDGYDSEEILSTNHAVVSFAEGEDGELYVLDIGSGEVHRLVDAGGSDGDNEASPVPALLSATGCVDPQAPAEPAAGLIEYAVAVPFWSDGADKERWLAIPDGTSIDVAADGDFMLPSGSVLMKHFRLGSRLVETRLFMRHPDGVWAGYSYEWDDAGTDATLVEGGKTSSIDGQDWIFPSGSECLNCHTSTAGGSLGLEAAQLNHSITYAATGRTANQLETLDAIAMFSSPLGDPDLQPALPSADDPAAALDARARAYLHSNCAHCHRPGGPTPGDTDLRFSTSLANTNACDTEPQSGDLGLGDGARIVAPGDPAASVLLARMDRRDANAMPPLASNLIDADGVALISDWIESLSDCQ